MKHNKNSFVNILLVEDNPGDVRLTKEAFHECNGLVKLHVTEDGEEAMAFLYKQGKYAECPRPDMVLLDLNLPRKDGREVLAEIKQKQDLKNIPVVILTTSKSEEDIVRTYDLHANCYLTKPVDLEEFIEMVQKFRDFWLGFVQRIVENDKN